VKSAALVGVLAGTFALLAPVARATPVVPYQPPIRHWSFIEYRSNPDNRADMEEVEVAGDRTIRAGRLHATYDFGPSSFDDPQPSDGRAVGEISATRTGDDFTVLAQSADDGVGNKASLLQYQVFTKVAADASMQIKLSGLVLASDSGAAQLSAGECDDPSGIGCPGPVQAEIGLDVAVYTTTDSLFHTAGGALAIGWADNWRTLVWTDPDASTPFWRTGDFNRFVDPGSAILILQRGGQWEVDLSTVPVGGEVKVLVDTYASAANRRDHIEGPAASSLAWLSDPHQLDGAARLQTTGLSQVGDPAFVAPPEDPPPPPVCPSGPDPASGHLQFSADTYTLAEWAATGPAILVTRTGGSAGAVSAAVTTSSGTAVGGVDYSPTTTTVTFADGDTSPRVVPVPILADELAEPDKTVTLTLSDPACVTLGALTSAVLTIADDDRPPIVAPPVPQYTIGGTVTGLEGTGLTLRRSGEQITPGNGPFVFEATVLDGFPYIVTVAAQPSDPAQVCTITNGTGTVDGADVTDIAVDCVTPPPNSDLDPSFGEAGKVITPDTDGGQAVVVQPDGRIVVAGDDTLARYDPDGTPDATFGPDGTGLVTTDLENDSCFVDGPSDVALQPDGKIVVVGIADGGDDEQNFGVQRYFPNGDLDTDFGDQGLVSTDFGGSSDCAYGVTIQADDKIVVAGETRGTDGNIDVGVARYEADGTPDASFGPDGTGLITTDIAGDRDIDADGNIVVVARVSVDSSLDHFSIVRYSPTGGLDSSFDDDGITDVTLGSAVGVAIDADGRIVAAGSHNAGIATGQANFAVWRFLAEGDADHTFSGDGVVTTDFPDVAGQTRWGEYGHDLTLQADGRIVVVGRADHTAVGGPFTSDLALVRYGTDGTLDATFGTGGTLTVDFAGGFDAGHDVAIQPDGRIVASATAANGTNSDLGLVRVIA
jgi:uncharacterized delta-60 repeat protein